MRGDPKSIHVCISILSTVSSRLRYSNGLNVNVPTVLLARSETGWWHWHERWNSGITRDRIRREEASETMSLMGHLGFCHLNRIFHTPAKSMNIRTDLVDPVTRLFAQIFEGRQGFGRSMPLPNARFDSLSSPILIPFLPLAVKKFTKHQA